MLRQRMSLGSFLSPVLLGAIAAGAIAAGCARDRNIDDYNQDRRGREAAKVEAIRGRYRGMLTSGDGREELIPVEIWLETTVMLNGRTTDSRPDARLNVEGRINMPGLATIPFRDSFYDEHSGQFTATIPVSLSSVQGSGPITAPSSTSATTSDSSGGATTSPGQAGSIDIRVFGSIVGDRFEGTLQAYGYDSYSTRFTLTRDAPLPTGGTLPAESIRRGNGTIALSSCLEAPVVYADGDSSIVRMRVDRWNTENARFLNLLVPFETVNLNLRFGMTTQYAFRNVQWDRRIGTVKGTLTKNVTSNNQVIQFDLDCSQTNASDAPGEGPLLCEWNSSLGGQIRGKLNFKPVNDPYCLQRDYDRVGRSSGSSVLGGGTGSGGRSGSSRGTRPNTRSAGSRTVNPIAVLNQGSRR